MAMKGKKTMKLYASTPAARKVKRSLSFSSVGEDIEPDIEPNTSDEHIQDPSNDQQTHSEPVIVRKQIVLKDWIYEAIIALGEPKKGASFTAIKKWIFSNKVADPGKTLKHLKKALLSDLNEGNITRPKSTALCHGVSGSFLLVKQAKQPAALKKEKTKESKKAEKPKVTKVSKASKQGAENPAQKQTKTAKFSKVQKTPKMPAVKTGIKARVSLNTSKITAKQKASKPKVPKAGPKTKSKDFEASPIEDEEDIPEDAAESESESQNKDVGKKGSKTAKANQPKGKPTKTAKKKDADTKGVPKIRIVKSPMSVDEEENQPLQRKAKATHTRATKKDELEGKTHPKGSGRAAESKPRLLKETVEPKLDTKPKTVASSDTKPKTVASSDTKPKTVASSDTKPKTVASKAAGFDGKPKNRITRAKKINLEVTMSRKDRDLSDTELSVKPNIFQAFDKSCASDTEVEKVNKAERSMKVMESRSRKANATRGKTKTNTIM